MSILDKHPAPWGIEELTTSPPIPRAITCSSPNIHHVMRIGENAVGRNELQFADEQVKRLILAAPELLGSLQEICRKAEAHGSLSSQSVAILHARELVASIDSGPAPKSKAEKERDELLAALKALVTESASTEMVFADQRPAGWNPPALEAARALIARIES